MSTQSAGQLLEDLEQGKTTALELTQRCLDTIREQNPKLQAFLFVDDDAALEQAKQVDEKRNKGQTLGKLAGLPVAVKDNICIAGQVTTAGSKILEDFIPPYDAEVISRMKNADAVLIGKTNLDEFGMGSTNENSGFSVSRNPWNPDCVPGGSSGGSAVAVATGMVPVALGSDTGGSIRQPASLCGVTGLKPTYGRVSRYGLIAYGSSLDQIGSMGKTVEDIALLLETIAGHDDRDSTSVSREVPKYTSTLKEPVQTLTIGIDKEHLSEGTDPEVQKAVLEAIKVYEGLGAKVKEISLPHTPYAIAAYYIVATAEASSNLARYDGVHYTHRAKDYNGLIDMYTKSRGEGFGAEVKRRVMLGTYALSTGYRDAYYIKALKIRRIIKEEFDKAFEECDVIIGPTVPTPAFKIGEVVDDPLAMYLSDVFTTPANLVGKPGISIPCGFSGENLPIGLHILAPAFGEEKLLRIAQMFQGATDWHFKRP